MDKKYVGYEQKVCWLRTGNNLNNYHFLEANQPPKTNSFETPPKS